jgi:hypothetical protein
MEVLDDYQRHYEDRRKSTLHVFVYVSISACIENILVSHYVRAYGYVNMCVYVCVCVCLYI